VEFATQVYVRDDGEFCDEAGEFLAFSVLVSGERIDSLGEEESL